MATGTSAGNAHPVKQVAFAASCVFEVVVEQIVGEIEEGVDGEVFSGTTGASVLVRVTFASRSPAAVAQLGIIAMMLNIEDLAMHDINEISGGQQQKVFIARALAQEPDVLLLDEPTSNLDIRHQLDVMDAIKNLVRKKNISAIMAIHDLNLGSRYADRIVMLNGGTIVAAGNPSRVLNPENIEHVYGVEAVVKNESGRPYIVPIGPMRPNGGEKG